MIEIIVEAKQRSAVVNNYLRHSGFVILSYIVEDFKFSFNSFGIANPKGRKSIRYYFKRETKKIM